MTNSSAAASPSRTRNAIVWSLSLLILVGACGLSLRKVVRDPHWMQQTDLALYVHAARALVAGADPYDYRIYAVGREPRYYGAVLPKGDPYAYSPGLAEVVAALLPLGEQPFRVVWWLLGVGSVALSTLVLLRDFGRRVAWVWVVFAAGLLFAGRIVQSDLYHGQANLLLLLGITLGLKFLADARPTLAGASLALVFACKPFLGILLLYLAWRRAWTVVLVASLGSLLVLAVSFAPALLGGSLSFTGWLEVSRYYSSPPFAARPDSQALYGLFLRLFTRQDNPFTVPWLDARWVVTAASCAIAVSLTALLALAVPSRPLSVPLRAEARAALLREVGVVYAFALALGPLTQGDYALFLLPGAVGVAFEAVRSRHAEPGTKRAWWLACAAWGLALLPLFLPWRARWGLASGDDWVPISGLSILLTGRIGSSFLLAGLAAAYALIVARRSAGAGPVLR